MIRFRAGNRHGAGSTPLLVLGHDRSRLGDASRQLGVRGRIVAVDTASEHCDGRPAGVERSAMGLAVDATRHPADDDEPGCSEIPRERPCDRPAVRRARARSDDGDCGPVEQSWLGGPAEVELRRGIVDRGEQPREGRVATPDAVTGSHGPDSSPGIRYESASAT